MKDVLAVVVIHLCITSLFIVVTQAFYLTRELLLGFYSLFLLFLLFWRFGLREVLKIYRKSGYNYRNIVILGYNNHGWELKRFFEAHPEFGYRFKGFFDRNAKETGVLKGSFEDVEDYVVKNQIDEIYYAVSTHNAPYLRKLARFAEQHLVRLKLVPDLTGISIHDIKLDYYNHLPVISFRREPLDYEFNRILKRSFDLAFSLFAFVFFLSWMFPLIALLIRLDSKGPIFFRQRRSGKDNKDFMCWKFRTMYINDEADTKQATRNDCRITRIGHFLRKTNLDELPQFINVLLGEMSVVGPRPHMIHHTAEYSHKIDNYLVRHLIKPGITGLAQAKGYRGETIAPWSMKNRVKVDIFYIEHWSFLLDLKVIFLTIRQMLSGDENAY